MSNETREQLLHRLREKQHGAHAGHSVEGFRKRFWRSLILTVPVLLLSPMLQHWAGLGRAGAG